MQAESGFYLHAVGNFQLGGVTVSIARYDSKSNSWSILGDASALPGPATSVSSDDANADSVFVAGSSASGTPYLMRWNGSQWTDAGSAGLSTGSEIQQIAFVPLDGIHTSNDIIESDRMLLVSGALTLAGVGAVSSALFDGANWLPFLTTATRSGSAGYAASLFFSASSFRISKRKHCLALILTQR